MTVTHKQADPKTEHKADHKPEDHKPEHKAAEHQHDPKLVTKKVQMPRGTDEVNQGGMLYRVPPDGVVDLPLEVAEHVIRQGGAKDIDPKAAPSSDLVNVRHVSDPNAGLWWGESYTPDKKGILRVPAAALEDIAAHGFFPVLSKEA